ncbi:MAG TPA: cupin domain-containing protein [Terriglobales bacterium]|nr:cupin domain-containing protein [Terriglobales bacterium]
MKKGENNMAFKVRRVVTGYDASGKSAVKTDESLPGVQRFGGITGVELWSTDQMPVDNSAAADAAQRAGFVKHILPNYVGTGGGTTVRINEILPGNERFTHRTETVDYCVQLSGELDCELESGEVVHLKPGDVFINRGGLHTWVNNGSVPSVGMAVMVDALPNEVNGKELRTLYRSKK